MIMQICKRKRKDSLVSEKDIKIRKEFGFEAKDLELLEVLQNSVSNTRTNRN